MRTNRHNGRESRGEKVKAPNDRSGKVFIGKFAKPNRRISAQKSKCRLSPISEHTQANPRHSDARTNRPREIAHQITLRLAPPHEISDNNKLSKALKKAWQHYEYKNDRIRRIIQADERVAKPKKERVSEKCCCKKQIQINYHNFLSRTSIGKYSARWENINIFGN